MKKIFALLLAVCCLAGCGSLGKGSYSSSKPHATPPSASEPLHTSVKDYYSLCQALKSLVHSQSAGDKISLSEYRGALLEDDIRAAIDYVMRYDALAAYAVEKISFQLGEIGNHKAVSFRISYHHNRPNLRTIPYVHTTKQTFELIRTALLDFETSLVFRMDNYSDDDFALWVEAYADENPHLIMERPLVTVNIFPETGKERLVELAFTYQTNRETLREMAEYVEPVFQASRLNVIAEEQESVRFSLMYNFLVERTQIQVVPSITPAYSIFRYGVGDSKAFAQLFAAMCRNAQLECFVVSGTKDGQPYFWNIICQDGVYYHVDILRHSQNSDLVRYYDDQMVGYVWDFDDYPVCVPPNNILQEVEN